MCEDEMLLAFYNTAHKVLYDLWALKKCLGRDDLRQCFMSTAC